jgi:hypothetical protein
LTEAQNFFFTLMEEQFPSLAARSGRDSEVKTLALTLIKLAEALFFNPERYTQLIT